MSTRFYVAMSIICFVGVGALNTESEKEGRKINPMKFIASVEGKSFYGNPSPPFFTWADAETYCTSWGMRLASITSEAQANALKWAYRSEIHGGYWTSGRDAKTWRQFSWNDSDKKVDDNIPFVRFHQPLSCLMLDILGLQDGEVRYHEESCGGTAAALCEIYEINHYRWFKSIRSQTKDQKKFVPRRNLFI